MKKSSSSSSSYQFLFIVTAAFVCIILIIAAMLPGSRNEPADIETDAGTGTSGDDGNTEEPPSTNEPSPPGTDEPSTSSPIETAGPSVDPPSDENIDYYKESGGRLELPVVGASGYASINTDIKSEASSSSSSIGSLVPGECFRIEEESGDWWRITSASYTGWIPHRYCFINLPDVVPSAIYYDSNALSSKFVSSGQMIPDISGEKLYDAYDYNERLGKNEYIMPILYSMAPKVCAAQHAALEEGYTLIIYETFRPRAVQRKVVQALTTLADQVPIVDLGISTSPWSLTWFISTGVSNHQRGYAFDVSLGEISRVTDEVIEGYTFPRVLSYIECEMQTPMHELSIASISMVKPVSSKSDTAWRSVAVAPTMNAQALMLRKICTGVGLSPLASEWWHFNDLATAALVDDSPNIGDYYINDIMSIPPEAP